MDETTVTVLVAVLGVLAGFVTSFFAEPVKIHFQDRARVGDMKLGLYKEMVSNFILCKQHANPPEDNFHKNTWVYMIREDLRQECFQHALKNDQFQFYKLPDALDIKFLNIDISLLLSIIPSILENHANEDDLANLASSCSLYVALFSMYVYEGKLDGKLLKKIIGKDNYRELVAEGQVYSLKNARGEDWYDRVTP